jgi:hypothetical protein
VRNHFRPGASVRAEFLKLVESGTIAVGTSLVHRGRVSNGYQADAVVVRDGIRVGSITYTTPSGAARAVTSRPVDGWFFWRLKGENRTLDSLRNRK